MERFFVVVAACAVAMVATGAPAFAHGTRGQGDMEFTVGWANEPALVGQPNAVQLHIEHDGAPLEGAEQTLKVTVGIGDQTTDPMELRTVFDAPGEYRADVIPTVVGGYTFHFTGTADGEKVDQTFVSPKDGFDEVEGTTDIAFPKQAPTSTELAEKLASVERKAADADASASRARFIGFVGVLIAIAGIGLGFFSRRRPGEGA
jgi:hypothetical protein